MDAEYGPYSICVLCDWEDDGLQLANPTSSGGANQQSLFAAQGKVLKRLPLSLAEVKGHTRGSVWRPLTVEECGSFTQWQGARAWCMPAVLHESDAYWRCPLPG